MARGLRPQLTPGVGRLEVDAEPGVRAAIRDDELEVVQRCRAGDQEAFRFVVERYGGLLYGTAYLMVRDRGQAEDIVQEAFVSCWRSLRTFEPGRPLRPWLLRILINQVLQRRRRRFLNLIPLSAAATELRGSDAEPERAAERTWEREELSRAIAALPPDVARIVVLRYFAELSVTEIAEALALREGTIKSRLHRALRRLRKELKGLEPTAVALVSPISLVKTDGGETDEWASD